MAYHLITCPEQLHGLLSPILAGRIPVVAFDTETNLVSDKRFTPLGTDTRIAGFSISYDDPDTGEVDLYCPIRHKPYDWTRRKDLLVKAGGGWAERLLDEEGVTSEGTWAEGWDPNLPAMVCFAMLEACFAAPGVEQWCAHSWRFDALMAEAEGVTVPWDRIYDTQIVSIFTDDRPLDRWIDQEGDAKGHYYHGGHGLKHLGEAWLGIDPEEKDLLDAARGALKTNDFSMLPLRTILAPYAAKDTRLVLALRDHQLKRDAYQDERVQELIRKSTIEIRLAVRMEQRGIGVDHAACVQRAEESDTTVACAAQKANGLAGRILPLGDPKSLARAIYQDLGLPIYRGLDNTRKATLKQVKQRLAVVPEDEQLSSGLSPQTAIELLDAIIDYRRVEKERSSFFRPLTYFGVEGRIHTILRTLQAKTTRYSASKPNVQQMPKTGDVRKLFRPKDGHVFLMFDYAGVELRLAAHYAQALPEAFEYRFSWNCTLAKRGDCKGKPPHGPKGDIPACKKVKHVGWRNVWSREPDQMRLVEGFMSGDRAFDPHQLMVDACHAKGHTHVTRQMGKHANFALIYGAYAYTLAETLDISHEFAMDLYTTFWETAYPELGRVKAFIDERLRNVGPHLPWSHQQFLRTLHGGHIYLDDGYYGFNYIVQRSCREILLNAILDTNEYTLKADVPYELILPVHDELIFECPADSVDEGVVRGLARTMVEAGAACAIPMIVDPSIAEVSWGETSDLPVSWGFNGVTDA